MKTTNISNLRHGIDVTGHTETDTLNVSGLSTFAGAVDINNDLDVDGRTELDTTNIAETLNVVGVTTLASAGGITTTGGDFYVHSMVVTCLFRMISSMMKSLV